MRRLLAYKDYSYGDIAFRVGCSKSLIGHLLTGRRSRTKLSTARNICKVLDVPIETLFLP
ncbi:helix-turn-helix transcriptional regulator [Trueperella sp. LYQ141]|uniref:helix-turn-helix transcriptional regulator n=1 Tax=Trueperella sp. LYQ141 TaxID=3391058 RepID=UPI0039839C05